MLVTSAATATAATTTAPRRVGGGARPPPSPLVLLDYDNTLLATTWLQRAWGQTRLAAHHHHHQTTDSEQLLMKRWEHISVDLRRLDEHVHGFLRRMLEVGHAVVLVTNARKGWVEDSCSSFMPMVHALLPRLRIISARSLHEEAFPDDPHQWKLHVFREELAQHAAANNNNGGGHRRRSTINVISIGDSLFEREAVHVAGREHRNALVKSVQLVDSPSPLEICNQLTALQGCIEDIAACESHLDLLMMRDGGPQPQPQEQQQQ